MNEQEAAIEKIVHSEAAAQPEVAALLGLWHAAKKDYPAAYLSFSTALSQNIRFGFYAVSTWRSEWGAKPLPPDFVSRAPLAAASFWAWAGKPEEGFSALKRAGAGAPEKVAELLGVYLQLLSLPSGPSHRPLEFRRRLEALVKATHGINSDLTRRLLALYDSGDLAGVLAGLRPLLEKVFAVPPFTSVDGLWLLFLSGVGQLDFASISAAVAELDGVKAGFLPGWRERRRAAGFLLLYFFLLRAGLESFEHSLKINPKFSRAAKNAELVKGEKAELAELIKQFSIF